MRYMDDAQIENLRNHIDSLQSMEDRVLSNWAREQLIEFCHANHINTDLIIDLSHGYTLEIPLDKACLTLYVSGLNFPDQGVSVEIEPASLAGARMPRPPTAPYDGLVDLASRLKKEADSARNRAELLENVVSQVDAFIASLPAKKTGPETQA